MKTLMIVRPGMIAVLLYHYLAVAIPSNMRPSPPWLRLLCLRLAWILGRE